MKFLLKFIVLIVVILVVGPFLLPKSWDVGRDITIDAEPAVVHGYIADLHKWEEWGAWYETDASIVTEYAGPESGVGAVQSWTSDSGNGRMECLTSDPETGATFELSFDGMEPSEVVMVFERVDGGTRVTWSNRGSMGEGWSLWTWFVPFMDSMMGADFEHGLGNLKGLIETGDIHG